MDREEFKQALTEIENHFKNLTVEEFENNLIELKNLLKTKSKDKKIYKLIAVHNPKDDNEKYETEESIFNPNENIYLDWIEYCTWEAEQYPQTLFYIEVYDLNNPYEAGKIIRYFNEHNFIYHVKCWTGDYELGYRKNDEFLVSPNKFRKNIYDVYKYNEKDWFTGGVNEIKKEHCIILNCENTPFKKE